MSTGQRSPRVAIVGAGLSGICMAAQLQRAGITNYTVFEKADRFGGTWRDNTYPGLTCDVPSRFYQFTFAPNPDWTHLFPPGAEILGYLEQVGEQFGVLDRTRFGCTVTGAVFDDGVWRVSTSDGTTETFDFLVSATGFLHHPLYPRIEGLESFGGHVFHSARWDHSIPLEGKRVAVIGTGSTGVQIVCSLAGTAAEVIMFQRTAQWTLPLGNRPISAPVRWLHRRIPLLNQVSYRFWRGVFEVFTPGLTKPGIRRNAIQWLSRRQLRKVADPELRSLLTPQYQPGCKRLVVNTTFYKTVQRPDVRVITDGIASVEPAGIRTAGGELVEADVLVLATGFDSHAYFRPMKLVGAGGVTIDEVWANGPRAYHTVAIPGFPNFFMLVGPSSPVGNYALTAVAETQVDHVLYWISRWRAGEIESVAPTRHATERFNDAVRARMPGTVWTTGCNSWYLGSDGHPDTFPWPAHRHRVLLRRVEPGDYDLVVPKRPEAMSPP